MDKTSKEKSMTALVCAFARAYHRKSTETRVFDDSVAGRLLYDEEYNAIGENMSKGIDFFNKDFMGNKEEALRWIVDNQLAPSTLGRSAYAERRLEIGVRTGIQQYLIFAAGFDTFGYRQPGWGKNLQIFEIDHPLTSEDKMRRLAAGSIAIPSNVHHTAADLNRDDWVDKLTSNSSFNRGRKSFCSFLGIVYYISRENFGNMMKALQNIIPQGSVIVMDYPVADTSHGDKRVIKQEMLAKGASEDMISVYSPDEMNEIMDQCGYEVIETLTPDEITNQFFYKYNVVNKGHTMKALAAVNFCAAVKK